MGNLWHPQNWHFNLISYWLENISCLDVGSKRDCLYKNWRSVTTSLTYEGNHWINIGDQKREQEYWWWYENCPLLSFTFFGNWFSLSLNLLKSRHFSLIVFDWHWNYYLPCFNFRYIALRISCVDFIHRHWETVCSSDSSGMTSPSSSTCFCFLFWH